MKREIKFRVWDDVTKSMYYPKDGEACDFVTCMHGAIYDISLESAENGKLRCVDYRTERMQYIDLKDKNGKEIYEGDIIKSPGSDNAMEVKYGIILESDDATAPGIGFQFNTYPDEMEVIGNIYENPELLKETNDQS